MFEGLIVASPRLALLGCGIVVILVIIRLRRAKHTAIAFQFGHFFPSSPKAVVLLRTKRAIYLLLVMGCFLVLAHPQWVNETQETTKKGIDIVLALDISYSMEANDFQPNRLEAAKQALQTFLASRTSDRIGLVVFAGKPFTSVPLTFDYTIFEEILRRTTTNKIDQGYQQLQGTAVGDGLLSSITLLQKGREELEDDEKREQIVVLFTDGEANVGLDPLVVAQLAKDEQIKVYTVGIGSSEGGSVTIQTPFGTRQQPVGGIDEATLQQLAQITDGAYARAVDQRSLDQIIQAIGELKPSTISDETHRQFRDARPFLLGCLLCVTVALLVIEKKSPAL